MPWIALAGAAVSAAPGLIGGSKGAAGPRNINWSSAQSDPWNLEARQASLSAQNQQQGVVNQLQGQNGIQNQSNVFNQQQQLADTLGQEAQGQGPNPALAQLANTTGQNIQSQAALMGSQRGASQNVGMMARQAGQQGANINQQASGQAAVLRAQQQLAAQQQLQAQQAQMAGLSTQQTSQLQNAVQNQTAVSQNQQNMQLQNLQQWNTLQANAAQGQSTNALGYAQMGNQQNAATAQGIGAGLAGMAGMFGNSSPTITPQSSIGNSNMASFNNPQTAYSGKTIENGNGGPSSKFGCYMKSGGQVAGKAQVPGNSPKNDTVPAMLSPGELVIDRKTLADTGKVGKAARMVQAYINKRNGRK